MPASSSFIAAPSSIRDPRQDAEAVGRSPVPRGSTSVVLADDHEQMRRSLRSLLESQPDFTVVAEAHDLTSMMRELERHRPDVLVLDLGMPDGSSIEAIADVHERILSTQVVVLTMQEDPAFVRRALSEGALGYVLKGNADGELVAAVRAAARGEEYVSRHVSARLDELHRALTDHKLTPREAAVLRLIALGHTSVEVGRKLSLSPRTVESHRAHIHKKLGVSSRAELVRYALRRGMLGI